MNENQFNFNAVYSYFKTLKQDLGRKLTDLDVTSPSFKSDVVDIFIVIGEATKCYQTARSKLYPSEKPQEEKSYILPEDKISASRELFPGWLSRRGIIFLDRAYGSQDESEEVARKDGANAIRCTKCGLVIPKTHSVMCDYCRAIFKQDTFASFPEKKYSECSGVVAIYDDDRFFFNREEIDDFCYDGEIDKASLKLVECMQSSPRTLTDEFFWDEMPSEIDECPKELYDLIDKFNKEVSKLDIWGWYPTNTRVVMD